MLHANSAQDAGNNMANALVRNSEGASQHYGYFSYYRRLSSEHNPTMESMLMVYTKPHPILHSLNHVYKTIIHASSPCRVG